MSKQSRPLLPPDYYESAAQFETNRPLHFLVRHALFAGLEALRGSTFVEAPASVKNGFDGPVVIAATHRSWEDIPRTEAAARKVGITPLRFVFKSEFYKPKIVGKTFEKVGGVAVDRVSPNTAGLLSALGSFLDEGQSVAFYPEGTRKKTTTRQIGELKSGATVLAARHRVPLVPLAIAGTAVDDEHHIAFGRKPAVAIFGEPITHGTNGGVRGMQADLAESLQACMNTAYFLRDNSRNL